MYFSTRYDTEDGDEDKGEVEELDDEADQVTLLGCFGVNGPLRQYCSLYRAISQREGERKEK